MLYEKGTSTLLTAKFFSILHYNADIWMISSLKVFMPKVAQGGKILKKKITTCCGTHTNRRKIVCKKLTMGIIVSKVNSESKIFFEEHFNSEDQF